MKRRSKIFTRVLVKRVNNQLSTALKWGQLITTSLTIYGLLRQLLR